jgi:uncharacterized glyoxalase superfamily protein PhnB
VLRNSEGPYLVLAEVPPDRELQVEVILKVADAEEFRPGSTVDVVTRFQETHYGAREMKVRDPDGRVWSVQAPAKN